MCPPCNPLPSKHILVYWGNLCIRWSLVAHIVTSYSPLLLLRTVIVLTPLPLALSIRLTTTSGQVVWLLGMLTLSALMTAFGNVLHTNVATIDLMQILSPQTDYTALSLEKLLGMILTRVRNLTWSSTTVIPSYCNSDKNSIFFLSWTIMKKYWAYNISRNSSHDLRSKALASKKLVWADSQHILPTLCMAPLATPTHNYAGHPMWANTPLAWSIHSRVSSMPVLP